jgi:uncharacterized protein (DUF342 family)
MTPISVKISDNGMEAKISIVNDGNSFPSEGEIYTEIKKAGIEFGTDHTAIREIIANQKSVRDVVIARGLDSSNLLKENLIWYVDLAEYYKPKITSEGKADFKQLKQIELVKKNQELVSQIPLQKPIQGRLVTGKEVGIQPNFLEQIKGKNIGVSEDGLTLFSLIDGCAFWKSERLNVDNIYHVAGNVDYRTGNVDFNGTVLIDGDVRSGFRVNATGSIYINGNVEAAEIYSENGDVIVKSGILGKGRAKILAGGNLHCRFLQDATIGVKKDVIIEHYAINSGISAGGKVYLIQNEGLIRGGKTFADDGMKALEVGSPQHISTDIGISSTTKLDDDAEQWQLDSLIAESRAKLSHITKKVEFLKLLEKRLTKLSREKEDDLVSSIKQIEEIEDRIKEIEGKKQIILEKSLRCESDKNIRIHKTIHRGVVITIGDLQYCNEQSINDTKIYRRGNQIYIERCGDVI